MLPRSLFNIVLKILGIFFIRDFLALAPQLLSSIFYLAHPDTRTESIWLLLSNALILVVYWYAFYYLIFKTETVIDRLKLDTGFKEQILSINVHRSVVLSIAIIVLGGLLVVTELPTLCQHVFTYFQLKRLNYGMGNPEIARLIFSIVKILTGIVLMAAQRPLVNLIERQRRK